MNKEWKCLCKQWVSIKYRSHIHASLNDKGFRIISETKNVEQWTYDRKPTDEVREITDDK